MKPGSNGSNARNATHQDGAYGWVVVAASFLNCTMIGSHMLCFAMLYSDIAEYFNVSLAYAGFIQSFALVFNFFPGN